MYLSYKRKRIVVFLSVFVLCFTTMTLSITAPGWQIKEINRNQFQPNPKPIDPIQIVSAVKYTPSEFYKDSIFYQRLMQVPITTNIRENLCNIALSQVGYKEGDNKNQLSGEAKGINNYTEYGQWYGLQDEWCAMFVSWCVNLVGDTNVKITAATKVGYLHFQSINKLHTLVDIQNGQYTPQPGDIIYFLSDEGRKKGLLTTHTGIIIDFKNDTIYTVEGNTSNQVAQRSYTINNKNIVGICELID